jgi:Protein of unknown function (DUF4241)
MTLQPPDFEAMFHPGIRYRVKGRDDDPDADAVVEVRDAGLLHLATGRLIACELLEMSADFELALSATVPPGRYPVTVSIARFDRLPPPANRPTRLAAAARLTIRDEPVARWEPAAWNSDAPAGDLPLGMDYSIGAFFDASALPALESTTEPEPPPDPPPAMDELLSAFSEGEEPVLNLVVDETAELNMILFRCPEATGNDRAWLGRTVTGEPACFVAELGLLSRYGSAPITG